MAMAVVDAIKLVDDDDIRIGHIVASIIIDSKDLLDLFSQISHGDAHQPIVLLQDV